MIYRKKAILIKTLALSIMTVVLGHYSPGIGQPANNYSQTDANRLNPDAKTKAAFSVIPLIDAAAPSTYETASFGLG